MDRDRARIKKPPERKRVKKPPGLASGRFFASCRDNQRGSTDEPIRNSSTARAHWRPSRMAHTTSDWPRRMSPAANTFATNDHEQRCSGYPHSIAILSPWRARKIKLRFQKSVLSFYSTDLYLISRIPCILSTFLGNQMVSVHLPRPSRRSRPLADTLRRVLSRRLPCRWHLE